MPSASGCAPDRGKAGRNETATTPSGSVRIPISISADTVIEDNETFSLKIADPGTNGSSPVSAWDLATKASCSPSPSESITATIVDDDVDLMAAKLVNNATPVAGGNVTYTVTFKNNTARPTVEPVTAHDATAAVADAVPPGLTFTSWSCVASGGASCPAASGSGAISGDAVLPAGSGGAGGSVTFTINALVGAAQCSNVTNTATVSVPASLQEATSSDNSASATIAPVCPMAVLALETASTSVSAIAGQNATLSFKVTNTGDAAADGTRIDDPIPSGLVSFTWACTAAGGAVCPNANGTGPISETAGTFPPGGSLTYVVTALVHASAPPTITNTVTVTPPTGGLCSGSCTLTMQVLPQHVIPALSTIGLLMLAASLAVIATLRLRR